MINFLKSRRKDKRKEERRKEKERQKRIDARKKKTERVKSKHETFDTLEDAFKKLIELKAVAIKGGIYTYSSEFEVSVKHVKTYPPRKFKQISVGRKIAKKLVPILVSTADVYGSKRDIENMVVAYLCLEAHFKRLHFKISNPTLLNLTHAIWFLNDHEPMAEEAT